MAKGGIGGKPIGGPGSVGGGPKGNTLDAPVTLGSVSGTGAVGTLALKSEPTVLLAALVAVGAVTAPTAAGSIFGSVTLGSLAAAGEVGVFGASSSPALLLAGVAAAGAIGSLDIASSPALEIGGVAAVGAVGQLKQRVDVDVSLAGVQAIGAVGDLHATAGSSIDANITLASISASGQVGDLAPSIDALAQLPGVAAGSAVGDLSAASDSVAVTLTGLSAAGEVGTLTASNGVAELVLSDAVLAQIASHAARLHEAERRVDASVMLDGLQAHGVAGPLSATVDAALPLAPVVVDNVVRLVPRRDAQVALAGLSAAVHALRPHAPTPAQLVPDPELEEVALVAAAIGWR